MRPVRQHRRFLSLYNFCNYSCELFPFCCQTAHGVQIIMFPAHTHTTPLQCQKCYCILLRGLLDPVSSTQRLQCSLHQTPFWYSYSVSVTKNIGNRTLGNMNIYSITHFFAIRRTNKPLNGPAPFLPSSLV